MLTQHEKISEKMEIQSPDLCSRYIKIFIVVSCYWWVNIRSLGANIYTYIYSVWTNKLPIKLFSFFRIVSIVTVFMNKNLLSSKEVHLDAPLFITWFQCLVAFVICSTLSRSGGIPHVFAFPKGTPWNPDVIKKVQILFRIIDLSSFII